MKKKERVRREPLSAEAGGYLLDELYKADAELCESVIALKDAEILLSALTARRKGTKKAVDLLMQHSHYQGC